MTSDALLDKVMQSALMSADKRVQQAESQQNRSFFQSPAFGQSLLRLGATLAQANEQGLGTGTGLALGMAGFGNDIQRETDRVRQARREATEQQMAALKDVLSLKTQLAQRNALRNEIDARNRRMALEEQQAQAQAQAQQQQQQRLEAAMQGLGPQEQALIRANPELLDDIALQEAPKPQFFEIDGQLVMADPQTGQAQRIFGQDRPDLDLTEGEKAVDRAFAKEFVQFNTAGGFADTRKQLDQLEEVATRLESGEENLTGPVVGLAPDFTKAFLNPESIEARDRVEEVVQKNLRTVLGSQFTEKEGERLISRAFNPRLDEKENAERVKNLIRQIKTAARQKQAASEYFQKNGTLKGFEGELPKMSDFDVDAKAPDTGAARDFTKEDLEFTAQKHGISVEEVKRRLGVQ